MLHKIWVRPLPWGSIVGVRIISFDSQRGSQGAESFSLLDHGL